MKFHLNRREFGVGAAAITLAAASITRPRAQAPVLKVGSLLPRSGTFALIGQNVQRAVDLAKTMLPQLGYSIEIIDADTESRVDVSRTQLANLIREGVHIFLGAFESGQTLAIAQVAEQNGIPFVVNIAADPAINAQGFR